ncbi:hypothetical protein [Mycolicibacterium sp.]|uniref:hypothetical protein n=1 Tax=Mycolicibacterium sp. TaxID=2320850 RepID=UPI0025F8610B|nr:hypothetical protein [Mycolicibacterium sp.]
MVVSHPIGGQDVDIATAVGIVIACHRLAADGLGVAVRDKGHVLALTTPQPWPPPPAGTRIGAQERIPPGQAAKAADTKILAAQAGETDNIQPLNQHKLVDSTCHRPGRLRAGSPERTLIRSQHTLHGPRPAPAPIDDSPATAARRLSTARARTWLELKLHDAAQALPAVLDQANAEGLSVPTACPATTAGSRGRRLHRPPARHGGAAPRLPRPIPGHLADFAVDAPVGIALIPEPIWAAAVETATNRPAHRPTGSPRKTHPVGDRPGRRPRRLPHRTTAADLAARCHRAAIEGHWAAAIRGGDPRADPARCRRGGLPATPAKPPQRCFRLPQRIC